MPQSRWLFPSAAATKKQRCTGQISTIRPEVSRSKPRAVRHGTPRPSPATGRDLSDEAAVERARSLRRSGKFEQALELMSARGRRSAALRCEEALLCFILGRDAVVRELAAIDPLVGSHFNDLLAACEGEPIALTRRRTSVTAKPTLLIAKALSLAKQGDASSAGRVIRPIFRSPDAARWRPELMAAVALSEPTLSREKQSAFARLSQSPSVATRPRLLAALAHDALEARLIDADPTTALNLAPRAAAFSEHARPVASLHAAFSRLRTHPDQAQVAFDNAIAAGADLAEALRGKWLAIVHDLRRTNTDDRQQRALAQNLGSTAEHLDRMLARDAISAPVRAALALETAIACGRISDNRLALEWISRARMALSQLSAVASDEIDQLDEIEAGLVCARDPKRALYFAESILSRNPKSLAGHRIRVSMGLAMRHPDLDRWIVEGAEITGDHELLDLARTARQRLGIDSAFAGLKPGQVSAGALAMELWRRTAIVGSASPSASVVSDLPKLIFQAAPFRSSLDSTSQAAFDAAVLAMACILDAKARAGADASALLASLFLQLAQPWLGLPQALEGLCGVLCAAERTDILTTTAPRIAAGTNGEEALHALATAAYRHGSKVYERVVVAAAAHVSREVLMQLHTIPGKVIGDRHAERRLSSEFGNLKNAAESPLKRIDRVLLPAFSIETLLDEGIDAYSKPEALNGDTDVFASDDDDQTDEDWDDDLDSLDRSLSKLARSLGLSGHKLFSLPIETRYRLDDELDELFESTDGQPSPEQVTLLFAKFGVFRGPGSQQKAKLSNKERKLARKQRKQQRRKNRR